MNTERINKLQEEIYRLKKEDREEAVAALQPLISSGKFKFNLQYDVRSYVISAEREDLDDLKNRLAELRGDSWDYSISIEIGECTYITLDGDKIRLEFRYSENPAHPDTQEKIKARLKELRIKPDVANQMLAYEYESNKLQKKITALAKWASSFDE